jgi:hypothetical protein
MRIAPSGINKDTVLALLGAEWEKPVKRRKDAVQHDGNTRMQPWGLAHVFCTCMFGWAAQPSLASPHICCPLLGQIWRMRC